jgi:hypothetical protein
MQAQLFFTQLVSGTFALIISKKIAAFQTLHKIYIWRKSIVYWDSNIFNIHWKNNTNSLFDAYGNPMKIYPTFPTFPTFHHYF